LLLFLPAPLSRSMRSGHRFWLFSLAQRSHHRCLVGYARSQFK
jgi:hypothetical protein